MKLPNIKICGLRDTKTIMSMEGLSFTEIGLVFAKSKRQVTPNEAAELITASKSIQVRDGAAPKIAGVFVNYPLEDMPALLEEAPLDIVQLHGQESLSYVRQLKEFKPKLEIWKVISITAKQQHMKRDELEQQLNPFSQYISTILLDAPGGGTGHTFNWEAIALYRDWTAKANIRLVVAGGLNTSNVTELITKYEVDGVDVSSGVETDGVKDITKIEQFVRRVIEA